jgi:uncharacterized protein YecE (DUF72 family)
MIPPRNENPRLLVGTSGYSYDDWVGPFYPPGTQRREFLARYAAEFPFVELNFSYYQQPSPATLARMVRATPDGFLFAIKAHQSLTHQVGGDLAAAALRFKRGTEPLVEAGRLAAVLLQFPYSFHYNPETRIHLQRLCESLAGLPLAVEFRNDEWLKESVFEGLRKWSAAFVNVDEPRLPRLPGPSEEVTAPLAYVRFHGRNQANWWKGTNVTRYDYLYDPVQLEDWVPMIERMLARVQLMLVAFNNHSRGQAVQNARDLMRILAGRGLLRNA